MFKNVLLLNKKQIKQLIGGDLVQDSFIKQWLN